MDKHSISASIVIYNNPQDEIDRIVRKLNMSIWDISVYIVDNYSESNYDPELSGYPIEYYRSKNVGYGSGHNKIISMIFDKPGFHFVINPDIDFNPSTIDLMIQFLIDNNEYSLLGPKLLGVHGEQQENMRFLPTPLSLVRRRLPKAISAFLPDEINTINVTPSSGDEKPVLAPFLSGAFMLFRNTKFRENGIFDERFFMYFEDLDISRRFFNNGQVVFAPQFAVTHRWEAASRKSVRMFLVHLRSLILYFNKWGWVLDSDARKINAKARYFLDMS